MADPTSQEPSSNTPTLQAPTLLIAMPQVHDPFFHRSVVLLASHDEDGSFGFVINRATNLTVADVLEELELLWGGEPKLPALLGGPVDPQQGTVLLASDSDDQKSAGPIVEIAPGVSITQELDCLRTLADSPPSSLRLVLGHAGWSPGQLDEEIQRHDWLLCPIHRHLVFNDDPDTVWTEALDTLGLSASELPEWTASGSAVN